MSRLLRAKEVVKLPVVTLGGEDVAQVKDVVFDGGGGSVAGFTLNGRGLFAGPLKESLPWEHVVGVGGDAVVVEGTSAFVAAAEVVERGEAAGRDVLGSTVITDGGTQLGEVADVVLEVDDRALVVGYEIEPAEALRGAGRGGHRLLVPLPETLSVSGEALMVPAAVTDFVTDDLAGFGAAVDRFRARLRGEGGQGA